MQEQYQTGNIELMIPADRSMMMVVRLTTAGVLARSPIGVDKLDDAKMAVEEACNYLVEQMHSRGRILLRFCMDEDGLSVVVRDAGPCGEQCGGTADSGETEIVRFMLEALADEVEMDVCGDWIREIRMRLHLGE